MRRRLLRFAFVVCALGAAACAAGGSSDQTADGGTAGIDGGTAAAMTVETVCQRLAETICAEAVTCGCGGQDLAVCLAAQQPGCERSFAGPISRVVLGRLTFDAASAEKCRSDYGRAVEGCASPSDSPYSSACARMFVDPAALGGQCDPSNVRLSCAGGSGLCAEGGACVETPGEGKPCANQVCAGDLVCVEGTCGAMPAPSNLPAGSECRASSQCAEGLGCVNGSCAAAKAIGESCDDATVCVRGAECQPSNERVCLTKAGDGERCMGDDCGAGLACDYTATFPVCRPVVALGEACDMGRTCVAGATCNAGSCVLLPTQGETCLFGQCAAGLVCDQSTQVCGERRPLGQSCNGSSECADGLACDMANFPGTCVTKSSAGGSCNGDSARCEAGLHCAIDGTCQPILPAGATCTGAEACGPQAECIFKEGPSGAGVCTPIPTTEGATCGFVCGVGLRCVQKPGACVPGLCRVL